MCVNSYVFVMSLLCNFLCNMCLFLIYSRHLCVICCDVPCYLYVYYVCCAISLLLSCAWCMSCTTIWILEAVDNTAVIVITAAAANLGTPRFTHSRLPSWSSRERITALTVALAWNSGDCETEAAYVQSQPISCVWKHRQCPGWQASTLLADELWLTMPPCPRVSKDQKSALRTHCFFLHSGGLGGKNKNTANTAAYWKARWLTHCL